MAILLFFKINVSLEILKIMITTVGTILVDLWPVTKEGRKQNVFYFFAISIIGIIEVNTHISLFLLLEYWLIIESGNIPFQNEK